MIGDCRPFQTHFQMDQVVTTPLCHAQMLLALTEFAGIWLIADLDAAHKVVLVNRIGDEKTPG